MSTQDWERDVAFTRLDFPPAQHDAAQTVAAIDDADEIDSAIERGGGLVISRSLMVSTRWEVVRPAP